MRIIIFGGTGFIGKSLLKLDFFKNADLFLISRDPGKYDRQINPEINMIKLDDSIQQNLLKIMKSDYGIVNLVGATISQWPWSASRKKIILNSRIGITGLISKLVNQAVVKPQFILQGSAVGYYGFENEGQLTEQSANGKGFLAMITKQWEDALDISKAPETRVIFIRTGLVLGRKEGLLPLLKLPFHFFAGGHFGNGKQLMPWIHISDEINAIEFLMRNPNAKGAFNLVAPNPIILRELMVLIGERMNRTSWLHLPAFFFKLLLGTSFANELLLGSQHVVPEKLISMGYNFKFSNAEEALNDLIQ